MNTLVAAFERGNQHETISGVAAAVATIVGADVREVDLSETSQPAGVERVLTELSDPETVLAVLSAATPSSDLVWQVLPRAPKPVIVVPINHPPAPITRALIPLDGSGDSATAVSGTIRLLARAGVELIVLHVFDMVTVPKFWDQSEHAERAWRREFLARYCDQPGARVELRTGVASDQVLKVAAAEDVDLIAVGWSQRLDGHARTLRHTLGEAKVPVLVVPIASG